MRKVRFTRVDDIRIDEDLEVAVIKIEDEEFILLGGEHTAGGVRNYLRPYKEVKENWNNLHDVCMSRSNVKYYMDNVAVLRVSKYTRELKEYENKRKW